jgi:hypothetical protein
MLIPLLNSMHLTHWQTFVCIHLLLAIVEPHSSLSIPGGLYPAVVWVDDKQVAPFFKPLVFIRIAKQVCRDAATMLQAKKTAMRHVLLHAWLCMPIARWFLIESYMTYHAQLFAAVNTLVCCGCSEIDLNCYCLGRGTKGNLSAFLQKWRCAVALTASSDAHSNSVVT